MRGKIIAFDAWWLATIQMRTSHAHNTPPILDLQGLITRAHAQRLNLEVSLFLSSCRYVTFENDLLSNDYIMIRNHGEDQDMLEGGLEGVEDQQGRARQDGGPKQTDFESVSESRTSLH